MFSKKPSFIVSKPLIAANSKILRKSSASSILSAVILLSATGMTSYAQTTWNGGTGNWTNSSNWTPSDPDSASTNVIINTGALNDGVVNLNADESRTVRDLTIGVGDQLNLHASSTLTIAGTVYNNGTLQNQGTLQAKMGSVVALDGGIQNTGGTLEANGVNTVLRFLSNSSTVEGGHRIGHQWGHCPEPHG